MPADAPTAVAAMLPLLKVLDDGGSEGAVPGSGEEVLVFDLVGVARV